jgi:D-aminoacyl-tRNA deacylase
VLYQACVAQLRQLGLSVQTGRFRTQMEVELVNDGPVSLIVEISAPAGTGQIDAS